MIAYENARSRPLEVQVVYRRYASLFFLVGVDSEENELGILEFIHALVETLDQNFGNVCELDIMHYLGSVHFISELLVHALSASQLWPA